MQPLGDTEDAGPPQILYWEIAPDNYPANIAEKVYHHDFRAVPPRRPLTNTGNVSYDFRGRREAKGVTFTGGQVTRPKPKPKPSLKRQNGKPAWDSTTTDQSIYKLSDRQQMRKTLTYAGMSPAAAWMSMRDEKGNTTVWEQSRNVSHNASQLERPAPQQSLQAVQTSSKRLPPKSRVPSRSQIKRSTERAARHKVKHTAMSASKNHTANDNEVDEKQLEKMLHQSTGSDSSKQRLLDAGCDVFLLQCLSSSYSSIIAMSAETIGNILNGSEQIRNQIISSEVVFALVAVLDHEDESVHEAVLMAVRNLTMGANDVKYMVVDADALPTLVKHLHSKRPTIVEEAAGTVKNLASGDMELVQMLASSDIPGALASALADASGTAQEEVEGALFNVSRSKVTEAMIDVVNNLKDHVATAMSECVNAQEQLLRLTRQSNATERKKSLSPNKQINRLQQQLGDALAKEAITAASLEAVENQAAIVQIALEESRAELDEMREMYEATKAELLSVQTSLTRTRASSVSPKPDNSHINSALKEAKSLLARKDEEIQSLKAQLDDAQNLSFMGHEENIVAEEHSDNYDQDQHESGANATKLYPASNETFRLSQLDIDSGQATTEPKAVLALLTAYLKHLGIRDIAKMILVLRKNAIKSVDDIEQMTQASKLALGPAFHGQGVNEDDQLTFQGAGSGRIRLFRKSTEAAEATATAKVTWTPRAAFTQPSTITSRDNSQGVSDAKRRQLVRDKRASLSAGFGSSMPREVVEKPTPKPSAIPTHLQNPKSAIRGSPALMVTTHFQDGAFAGTPNRYLSFKSPEILQSHSNDTYIQPATSTPRRTRLQRSNTYTENDPNPELNDSRPAVGFDMLAPMRAEMNRTPMDKDGIREFFSPNNPGNSNQPPTFG